MFIKKKSEKEKWDGGRWSTLVTPKGSSPKKKRKKHEDNKKKKVIFNHNIYYQVWQQQELNKIQAYESRP